MGGGLLLQFIGAQPLCCEGAAASWPKRMASATSSTPNFTITSTAAMQKMGCRHEVFVMVSLFVHCHSHPRGRVRVAINDLGIMGIAFIYAIPLLGKLPSVESVKDVGFW